MTRFSQKSFTVPLGSRDPKDCECGFIDAKGRCVFCGRKVAAPTPAAETPAHPAHIRYLPHTEAVRRGDVGDEAWHTIYPGLIDVRCYPELEPYTLPADQAP